MSGPDSNALAGGGGPRGESLSRRDSRDDPDDVMESCFEFMGSYVTKSLRVKYDKWQKLVTSEETKVRHHQEYQANFYNGLFLFHSRPLCTGLKIRAN